jgi:flavodoxin
MSTRTHRGRNRAAVVYSSRFGTTEMVAKALESGLEDAGFEVNCANTDSLPIGSLRDYDLICVGGPTEMLTASKRMKDFLKKLKGVSLEGKLAFAFDTKYHSVFSGSASKCIEHALDDQGLRIVADRESATVNSLKEGGKLIGATLKDGELKRFKELGNRVGAEAFDMFDEAGVP